MLTVLDPSPALSVSGDYSLEQALADMHHQAEKKGKTVKPSEEESFKQLFLEIFQAIDAKQLRPMVRTQYMRTAFQVCLPTAPLSQPDIA